MNDFLIKQNIMMLVNKGFVIAQTSPPLKIDGDVHKVGWHESFGLCMEALFQCIDVHMCRFAFVRFFSYDTTF